MASPSFNAQSYNFDPGLGVHKMCIHFEENGGMDVYALVTGGQSCPAYSSQSNNGCVEVHIKGNAPTWVCPPTQSASSQHCWVEEEELNDN